MAAFSPSSLEPVIMVHRGWKELHNTLDLHYDVFRLDSRSSSSSDGIIEQTYPEQRPQRVAQEFAFVNATTPFRNRDPEVRKLVRGHVVKDTTRKKKLQREKRNPPGKRPVTKRHEKEEVPEHDWSVGAARSSAPPESATATTAEFPRISSFPTKELDPHPQLSPIIYHITAMGNAMYPLVSSFRFNPISPAAWFDFALSDEALFHTLLYTTSSYAGLISGSTESKDSIIHVGKSVSLVKERLNSMGDVRKGQVVSVLVEATVRAVSCLAITEAMRGNFAGWKIHMMGLKQMVEVRGGITQFSLGLQLKLHRADLMGATDYLYPPFFSHSNALPSIPSRDRRHSTANTSLSDFLDTLPISPELSDSLLYMHNLSKQISSLLSSTNICTEAEQVAFLKHTYTLRYSLLPSPKRKSTDPGAETLDEALRIGALLYIQATPQEFAYAAIGPAQLVKRLSELVLSVQIWNQREGRLVLWLLFMGALGGKGVERIWFVGQIERLSWRLGLREWDEVRGVLGGLWWVGDLHERGGREVWGEVEGLRGVLRGSDGSSVASSGL